MNGVSELKRDVISACRILCEQKLVEGFGHVSARLPDSESFLLTPRISLALVEETDLLSLNLDGKVVEGHNPVPFEAWLHTAIMLVPGFFQLALDEFDFLVFVFERNRGFGLFLL